MRNVRTILTSTLREAVRSILGARLRTLLGLIGIMIGIASVITMISTGEIAKSQARKEFEALGTDLLTIKLPDRLIGAPGRATIGLEDALALAGAMPSVSIAAPRIQTHSSFRYAGKPVGSGPVQGVSASFAEVNRLETAEGRFVSNMDRERYFAVVGADVAEAMRRQRGTHSVIGEVLEVEERLYTVIGVLRPSQEAYALPFWLEADKSLFVPIGTVRRTEPEKQIELIVARAAPGVHYADAARDVQAYFAKRSQGLELDIVSAEQLIEQMESQLGLMTLLLAAVGSVSLIVGGIGVMNIMLISVTDRRREIGVRRALGANRGDILRQFLIESLILTLGGGAAGVVVGTGMAWGISHVFEWDFFVSSTSIVAGVGVSTAIGVFFGLQPAYQASRLDPIVALQGE